MVFFARAALHCVPGSQPQSSWEQLRANLHPATRKPRVSGAPGLRRKEDSFFFWCDMERLKPRPDTCVMDRSAWEKGRSLF